MMTGKPIFLCGLQRFFFASEFSRAAGCDGKAALHDNFASLGFVAQHGDVLGRRADKFDADGFADFGEVGVL